LVEELDVPRIVDLLSCCHPSSLRCTSLGS
jgi:hypothetical protein